MYEQQLKKMWVAGIACLLVGSCRVMGHSCLAGGNWPLGGESIKRMKAESLRADLFEECAQMVRQTKGIKHHSLYVEIK